MQIDTIIPARVNPVLRHHLERRTTLSGEWSFRLDPDDRGVRDRWFARPDLLEDRVQVPGSWQGQGLGGDGQDMVWDFRLEARTLRATYKGTGWYAKAFAVPPDWAGQRIWLNFGGIFPTGEIWVNGRKAGETHEPFVPAAFEITNLINPGRENTVVVRVHEQDRILGMTYSFQGNWSGLYRDVELTATGPLSLEQFRVYPDLEHQRITVAVKIDGPARLMKPATLEVRVVTVAGHRQQPVTRQARVSGRELRLEIPISNPRPWSPDSPSLYRVDAVLKCGRAVSDALAERVGFVKLATAGKQFLINGDPYYLRGTGEFLSNPETGCPDTDRARWRRKLQVLRDYGYNYVRCQSFVPAPEYYDVADEVGLLVQSEMGMLGGWGSMSQWHGYAWPPPTPGFRRALKTQWDHVVHRDVNHVSANLYCMSNELGKETLFPRTAWQCHRDTKAVKPTAFVIWTDGGQSDSLPGEFVNAEAEFDSKCGQPVIQHEFRWWSSYPDVRIMHKYSGAVRPYGAEIAIAAASKFGLERVLPRAAETSTRLQFVEAKSKMENCRRDNPTLAGICHFDAMDANPSPQGIFDEFYERKHATAATWRETNGDTVILSSLGFDDRIWVAGERKTCRLLVSDFSHPPFVQPVLSWKLLVDGRPAASGRIQYRHTPFRTAEAGAIELEVPKVQRPARAQLSVQLSEGRRRVTNTWNVWLFPARTTLPAGLAVYGAAKHTWAKTVPAPAVATGQRPDPGKHRVLLTEQLDRVVLAYAKAGGRVILAGSEGLVRPFSPKFGFRIGHYFFTPPANYPPYEDGHDGTIILDHPLLGDFPHEGFADLQFFRMITDSPPFDLDPLGLNHGDPVIRVMHSYPVCRPLGYLLERAVGNGCLILCALDLNQSRPEARWLLARLGAYASGQRLAPAIALSPEAAERIAEGTALP